MRRFTMAALASAIACLASACDGGVVGERQGNNSPAAADAPISLTASGVPKRADGYWELHNIGGGGDVVGTQFLCIGGGSEERRSLFDQIARNVNCSKYDIARAGAGWTFDFSCGAAGMISTSKGTVSGDFARAYRIEQTEGDGTVELKRTVEAQHAGACPSGAKPGDLFDEKKSLIANILD